MIDQTDNYILKLVAEGMTMKEIGRNVFMSLDGVRDRLRKMRKAHNCRSTAQLIFKVFHKEHTNVGAKD